MLQEISIKINLKLEDVANETVVELFRDRQSTIIINWFESEMVFAPGNLAFTRCV